jgi:hypothetical protein
MVSLRDRVAVGSTTEVTVEHEKFHTVEHDPGGIVTGTRIEPALWKAWAAAVVLALLF